MHAASSLLGREYSLHQAVNSMPILDKTNTQMASIPTVTCSFDLGIGPS
jgi:hypothetical protein